MHRNQRELQGEAFVCADGSLLSVVLHTLAGAYAPTTMSIKASGHSHPTDSMPHLKAAGIGGGGDGESCEVTLKPEIYNKKMKEPCPEHILKWRTDFTPGRVILHPGVAEDTDFKRLEVYGRSEPVGVMQVMVISNCG